jgi:endonuclease/exonuclease/phosphatase family metal-dependent hydrolase
MTAASGLWKALLVAAALAVVALLPTTAGAAGAAPPAAAAAPSVTLNVMVFNIEDGGTLVSFAKVVQAIRESGADVVGIEEAEGHIPRLAHDLGWPYYSTRYQVVSKYPLIDPPSDDNLHVLVEPVPGKVVALMNVHLPSDPYGPYWIRDGKSVAKVIALEKSVRLPAIAPRLAALPGLLSQGIPVFLTGDFNSPSSLDWTPAAIGSRSYDRGTKPWPPVALDWPVSKAVLAAGFRDSYRDIYPDPVTHPGITWWARKPHVAVAGENFGPLDVKDRIDYVYAAGASTTTASRIVGETQAAGVSVHVSPWPSDHRAVVSTLQVTPATPPVFVATRQRLLNVGTHLAVTFHSPGGPDESVAITGPGGAATQPPVAEQPTGSAAPTDGTLSFATRGLRPGHYRVSLRDGAGAELAHCWFWLKAPRAQPRVFTARRVYKVGQPIVVEWRDTPGERWDWVAVYDRRADPNVAYYYLWGYTFATIAGHCTLDRTQPYFGYDPQPWPLKAGTYSIYLLRDDGYSVICRKVFRVVK